MIQGTNNENMNTKDQFLTYYIMFILYHIISYFGVKNFCFMADLGHSFSLEKFFTPKDNNFVDAFKCYMAIDLRLV